MYLRAAFVGMTIVLCSLVNKTYAEDYNYFEFSQGINISTIVWGRTDWQGSCPTEFALGHHFDITHTQYVRVSASHISNICEGPPFNDKTETTLDQVRITVGVKW